MKVVGVYMQHKHVSKGVGQDQIVGMCNYFPLNSQLQYEIHRIHEMSMLQWAIPTCSHTYILLKQKKN